MNNSYLSSYFKKERFTADLCGDQISFISKRGIPNWDQVTPQTRLIADTLQLEQNDPILLLGCGHGLLAVFIAKKVAPGTLSITDHNFLALELTRETLEYNNIQNAILYHEGNFPQSKFNQFSAVVIELQKGRKLTRRLILDGYQSLYPGGRLYLGGANSLGIKSAVKDAEALFGNSSVLGYRKGNRVVSFEKQAGSKKIPDWTGDPGVQLGSWYSYDLPWKQKRYQLHSLPGVFSYKGIDQGTALLLDNMQVEPGMTVLDIGCGNGILGFAASLENAARVDLIDTNLLAVVSAEKNFTYHGIENFSALPSDGLCAVNGNAYDLILTNPPFHTGSAVDYSASHAIFAQSKNSLTPSGKLILVANRFIRYDHLLEKIFKSVKILQRTNRYHIVSASDLQNT